MIVNYFLSVFWYALGYTFKFDGVIRGGISLKTTRQWLRLFVRLKQNVIAQNIFSIS